MKKLYHFKERFFMKKYLFTQVSFFLMTSVMFVNGMKNNEPKKIDIPFEIEIKFQVDSCNFKKIFDVVLIHSKAKNKKEQIDAYFDTVEKILATTKQKLRIRDEINIKKNTQEFSFCFKHKYINPETNKSETKELEATIDNKQGLLNIFDVLEIKGSLTTEDFDDIKDLKKNLELHGYKQFATIEKIRNAYLVDYKDSTLEIALDKVKGLTDNQFIEIELKNFHGGSVQEGKDIIYNFLSSIGVSSINEYPNDYLSMLLDPKKITFVSIDVDTITKK